MIDLVIHVVNLAFHVLHGELDSRLGLLVKLRLVLLFHGIDFGLCLLDFGFFQERIRALPTNLMQPRLFGYQPYTKQCVGCRVIPVIMLESLDVHLTRPFFFECLSQSMGPYLFLKFYEEFTGIGFLVKGSLNELDLVLSFSLDFCNGKTRNHLRVCIKTEHVGPGQL